MHQTKKTFVMAAKDGIEFPFRILTQTASIPACAVATGSGVEFRSTRALTLGFKRGVVAHVIERFYLERSLSRSSIQEGSNARSGALTRSERRRKGRNRDL
jgi:hypothetical protein